MFASVNRRTDALTDGHRLDSHPITVELKFRTRRSEIYRCDYLMSFMKGDRLTLELEQYFKMYLFSLHVQLYHNFGF